MGLELPVLLVILGLWAVSQPRKVHVAVAAVSGLDRLAAGRLGEVHAAEEGLEAGVSAERVETLE